jgi:hypothetical protein
MTSNQDSFEATRSLKFRLGVPEWTTLRISQRTGANVPSPHNCFEETSRHESEEVMRDELDVLPCPPAEVNPKAASIGGRFVDVKK